MELPPQLKEAPVKLARFIITRLTGGAWSELAEKVKPQVEVVDAWSEEEWRDFDPRDFD